MTTSTVLMVTDASKTEVQKMIRLGPPSKAQSSLGRSACAAKAGRPLLTASSALFSHASREGRKTRAQALPVSPCLLFSHSWAATARSKANCSASSAVRAFRWSICFTSKRPALLTCTVGRPSGKPMAARSGMVAEVKTTNGRSEAGLQSSAANRTWRSELSPRQWNSSRMTASECNSPSASSC